MENILEKLNEMPSEKIDNFVFRNNGDFTFSQMNEDWGITFKGFSNGSVYADLDNDGDLEIVNNNIDDHATIFENKSSENNNHIALNLKGPEKNPFGIGGKISLYTDSIQQFQELTLSRGFQSSVAPRIHFGLGKKELIDSLRIIWPDGKVQLLKNISVNQSLTLDHKDALVAQNKTQEFKSKLFSRIQDSTFFVKHKHIENFYDDFIKEILLPHQTSRLGPAIAVGDLNGDKLDDYIVGGASQNLTALYFQSNNGFIKQDVSAAGMTGGFEDMGILIFDADNDQDSDIYIVSGGNEFEPDSPQLQDRLYVNDGQGNFTKSETALPKMITSGSRVHSFDYDKDGDLDLFVGGRLIPGSYPLPANSYILENISQQGIPKFVDVTQKIAPALNKLGMVTDATWADYDNDGWTDLIIVGEWMSITLLKNNQGKFENQTEGFNLGDSLGWWFSVKEGDFDQDGDLDFIVGNLGQNFKYKASEEATFDIYFNDFDNNKTNDIVLSYFNDGKEYPLRGRECSSQQIPAIKKKFEDYASFSEATLIDVYTEDYLENSLHYQVKSFASIYLENKNGTFIRHKLPNLAQFSSINQILIDDFDKDSKLDAIIAGNMYSTEVETPRNDASNGLFLKGDGSGGFQPIKSSESGFFAPGDVKDMSIIHIKGKPHILVAKNNDYLQLNKINTADILN